MKRCAVFTLTLCSVGNILFAEADKAGSGPATDGRTEKLLELRERIHGILEKRFFSSENILYDYAGPNGEVVIPTAEECLANKPNAFAWNTPIENGGFFNGDLLAGLCDLYEKFPSEKLAKQMRTLARGLYVLQDKSPVKGCILRGIGSDGKSFYPASSTDQVIPFLLGLWRYSQSKASTPEEKADCRRRCRETALALKQNHWIVPGARKGFNRGNIANKKPYDMCAILLAAMILDQTDPDGISEFDRIFEERKDAVFAGYPDIPANDCWFSAHNYYILAMVADAYPAYRKQADHALKITAEAASKWISCWKQYVPGLAFTPDWHPLNSLWREQKNSKDAVAITGGPFWSLWTETCPAVMNERRSIMSAFAAAWIVLMSGDQEIIAKALPDILEALDRIPFDNLYYSPFFFAENVIAKTVCLPAERTGAAEENNRKSTF